MVEHIPSARYHHIIKPCGTMGKHGRSILAKADADANMVSLIGRICILEHEIPYAQILPGNSCCAIPLRPGAHADLIFHLGCTEPLLDEAPCHKPGTIEPIGLHRARALAALARDFPNFPPSRVFPPINSKVTGSGIGLLLVGKLVRLHKGKLNFSSMEGKGSCIKITFPKGNKHFRKAIQRPQPQNERIVYSASGVPINASATPSPASSGIYDKTQQQSQNNSSHQKILIVEDNDELREYLRRTLSEQYNIQVCSNGKEALTIVKEYMPNLVISDIMMPEMRGDELCHILKNDIETSHIPIILLTALNTDKNIIEGLQSGADEYIVKPFNIGILRANIANLLTNRTLLRHKYASLDLNDEKNNTDCINCSNDLDWKFIATVKKSVEDNMDNPSFNVDVLCNLLNMSRTSFYNKIKALTDQAPADYIRLIRLKHAAQLLKEQKHTITEISELTGFSDAKYFREVFKKHFNMSPSQYAKRGKEGKDDEEIK